MEVTGSMAQAAERGRTGRTEPDPGAQPGTLQVFDEVLSGLGADLDGLAEVVRMAEERLQGVLHVPVPEHTDDAANKLALVPPPTPLLERVHGVEACARRVRLIAEDLRGLLGRVDL